MEEIYRLANQFRNAIDEAQVAGEFINDTIFSGFPTGCCGFASDLLAEFLREKGIETYDVSGQYGSGWDAQSHAWLLLMADQKTIIDITGDQFRDKPELLYYNKSVYVGAVDAFHRLFIINYCDMHKIGDGMQRRMDDLYRRIVKYIR